MTGCAAVRRAVDLDDTAMTQEQIRGGGSCSADVLVTTVTDMVGEAILKHPTARCVLIRQFRKRP